MAALLTGHALVGTFASAQPTAADPVSASAPAAVPEPARPRVGLVLSGGGARGLAHVGVLKVLEQLRIPVDCVAGTSMGAIVGGAFASGTSPADMAAVVRAMDWNAVFDDRPPRAQQPIRRRVEEGKPVAGPDFAVGPDGLTLPRGVVVGIGIESFLRRLTPAAREIERFSDLPIPFRAVAADIETGEEVVLGDGSLPLAMRASMSVPGAIVPVEVGGRLLVDGGIANNLPIDVARRLCADVVIAVNLPTRPLTRGEITSALSVVTQLTNFLGKARVDEQLASLRPVDVLISPELGTIGSGSFDRAAEAMAIGERAAQALADRLAALSLSPLQWAAHVEARTPPAAAGPVRIDAIRLTGLQRVNEAVLRRVLETRAGSTYDEARVADDQRRIFARGDFEAVDAALAREPDGRHVLEFTVRERDSGTGAARFGLALASDFRSSAFFSLYGRYRQTWLNALGAEFTVEGQLGRRNLLGVEFLQPLNARGDLFVAPYAAIERVTLPLFVGERRIAEYLRQEARVGLDLGIALGTLGELRAGPVWREVRFSPETALPLFALLEQRAGGVQVRAAIDRLDDPWFPRSGVAFALTALRTSPALGADASYERLEARAQGATASGPYAVRIEAAGGTGFGSALPIYDGFTLGGPLRLSAYRFAQFLGESYGFGRVEVTRQVLPLPRLLGTGVLVGSALEVGRMRALAAGGEAGVLTSLSAFVGASTFLGPLRLGAAIGRDGARSLFLQIGQP